jgi:hypothetical protein
VRARALLLGAQPMSYPREVGQFFAARSRDAAAADA